VCFAERTRLRAEPRRGWELSEREAESSLGPHLENAACGPGNVGLLALAAGEA